MEASLRPLLLAALCVFAACAHAQYGVNWPTQPAIPFATEVQPGTPAAIVTGTFRLRLKLGAKTVDKNLVLYNDVLVEDLEQQDVFYRVNRVRLSGYVARFA